MFCRYSQGNSHSLLYLIRSRVSPLKRIKKPGMELTATMVTVCMCGKLNAEVHMCIASFFWTESMALLCHAALSISVSIIRDATDLKQWRYVSSNQNPADLTSPGSNVVTIFHNDHRPTFIKEPSTCWPQQPSGFNWIHEEDPEIKHIPTLVATAILADYLSPLDAIVSLTSNWTQYVCVERLIRTIRKVRYPPLHEQVIHMNRLYTCYLLYCTLSCEIHVGPIQATLVD